MSTNESGSRRVRTLGQLPGEISPPRDLWPGIAAQIAQDAAGGAAPRRLHAPTRMQWAALAAVVAALAIGMWLGRNVLPVGGMQSPQQLAGNGSTGLQAAAYLQDPRYLKDRAELVRSLDAKLKTLPPQTQRKVKASLATIRKSIAEIQAALGRDPGNALLQEMLVNSYTDEMRVLTAVHEADSGRGEI